MTSPTRGAWILGTDPVATRTVASAGYDWIALDLQHGRLDDAAMIGTLAATSGSRRWVRVRARDAGLIGRALDAGADGVIIPMVDSVDDARAAAAASLYPPRGARSWGPFGAGYGRPEAAPDPLCAVMIETAPALAAVDEIARVPGVDMLFVGPFDLALALSIPLDDLLADDATDAPLRRIVGAARAAGRSAGAFAGTPERGARLRALGFEHVAVTTDMALLEQGSAAVLGA